MGKKEEKVTEPETIDTTGALAEFDPALAEKVELVRTWVMPTDNGPWIVLSLLERSRDVRDLFPGGMSDDPAYLWAAELLCDVGAATGAIVKAGEKVSGKRGDLVFLFEPRRLADAFARAHMAQQPICFRSSGVKRGIDSKRLKRKVNVREWEIRKFPNPFTSTIDPTHILMPSSMGESEQRLLAAQNVAD